MPVHLHTAPPIRLGAIEGKICILHQKIRLAPIFRKRGNADTGRCINLHVTQLQRACHPVHNFLSKLIRFGPTVLPHMDGGKLIPAQTDNQCLVAKNFAQNLRHPYQQGIANIMTISIIDTLEAIQIEHQQGRVQAFPFGIFKDLRQLFSQQGPVAELSQTVFPRLPRKLMRRLCSSRKGA